jgi:Na+/proline symporter
MARRLFEGEVPMANDGPASRSPDELASAGLLTASVIVIAEWLNGPVGDTAQLAALVAFAIAIPVLGVHLFLVRTPLVPGWEVGQWLTNWFALGALAALIGLALGMFRASPLAAAVVVASSLFASSFLGRYRRKESEERLRRTRDSEAAENVDADVIAASRTDA